MNIEQYLKDLNLKSQEVFSTTIADTSNLGKSHHFASFIGEFSEILFDENEKRMFQTVAVQLESATLNLIYGMYRQAFSSLRLAFELGLGTIHFSVHKLEHYEWMKGENDIKWSKLIDVENGIISKRFSNAFFPELNDYMEGFNSKSKSLYREMSEFVHGNNETWQKSGFSINYNEKLKNDYFSIFKSVSEILIFLMCCRYLKSLEKGKIDEVSDFLLEEMQHIYQIRELLGGVKEK